MAAVRGADPRLVPEWRRAGRVLFFRVFVYLFVCLFVAPAPIPTTQLCHDGATKFYDFEFVLAGCLEVGELKGRAVSRSS